MERAKEPLDRSTTMFSDAPQAIAKHTIGRRPRDLYEKRGECLRQRFTRLGVEFGIDREPMRLFEQRARSLSPGTLCLLRLVEFEERHS